MRLTALHTPRGARDILPLEACRKEWVEARLGEIFTSWGYLPVVTPTFEFFDSLSVGNGPGLAAHTYRFLERDGSTLALRPEVTTPIARMVATRLREEIKPLRLRYVGNVFRYDQPQAGRQREFTQAGVELLGAAGPRADAEIVALAVKALRGVGLQDFCIDIGHAGFFAGIVSRAHMSPQVQESLRQTLLDRDFVALEQVVHSVGVPPAEAEALLALSGLRGGQEVLDIGAGLAGNPESLAALDDLRSVYELLNELGVADAVTIDLSLVKDFTYYTGLVMEGYTREMGFNLCTGGRYDGLIGRFGYDCPATGFALGVERLLLALERQGSLPSVTANIEVKVVASKARFGEAASYAEAIRANGFVVAIDVSDNISDPENEPSAACVSFLGDQLSEGIHVSGKGPMLTLGAGLGADPLLAELRHRLREEGR